MRWLSARALSQLNSASFLLLEPLPARGEQAGFELQMHDAYASSERGCTRDQDQACPYDDDPESSRHALAGRCETFYRDRRRRGSHRAQVHDADDQKDRRQSGTAVTAVEAKAQTMSPGGASVRW